jgi:hypothetical protein
MVFMQPQRLVVPLFQRPYVWNEEQQWEPLWNDVIRVVERFLRDPQAKHYPHFLGAVVLQQSQNPTGLMQERTIIDGQQRLTTLQLLLDALHAQLLTANVTAPALRLEPLVTNAEPFCVLPEDRFKVWPTNRDRASFNAVMAAEPPVDHRVLEHAGERMVEAHRYFSEQAQSWLFANGPEDVTSRGVALETVVRDLLQMVVIDLTVDENAQEIFETLNARGAQLTAADLIKNFVFQRLLEAGADVEHAYDEYWHDFETAFWESEVSVGRLRYPRSSIFLNHWLVARTGEEVVAREVFARFKNYADFDAEAPMARVLEEIDRAALIYRSFVLGSTNTTGPLTRLELFSYRTSVLESEVIKPLVLYLLDPEDTPIPPDQLLKALDVLESWMVRRMLVRATTKNYNQVVAELIAQLRKGERTNAGDTIESVFAGQTSSSRYWPDDNEVRTELRTLMAYRRLGRGRLRMILEAIEDHLRGWHGEQAGLGGERVTRGSFHIEHVMPRKWVSNWPLPTGTRADAERDRDRLIHTIGNLTLLTSRLNTRVSNGPWLGEDGKRHVLEQHDVLFLNREIVKSANSAWTDNEIHNRSEMLADIIIEIWPVPAGHTSGYAHDKAIARHKVDLSDLISAGSLESGSELTPRGTKFAQARGVVLADGRIDVAGVVYSTPSEAAKSITNKPTNGWRFFLVDKKTDRALRDIRRDYLESFADDIEDDDAEEADDDA